jgi:hypothetical protein
MSRPASDGWRATRFATVVALGCAACTGGADGSAQDIVLADSAGIQIVTVRGLDPADLPEWTLGPDPAVEIGAVDGPGHDLHWPRAASRLPGGAIIVANRGSNEIREFDASGRYVRSLGRKGAGPGEFQNLSWTGWLDGDTIVGYDPPNRRLTVFAPDGSVARTVTLPLPNTSSFPEVAGILANGSVLAYPGFDRVFSRGERRDTIAYMIYPPDGSRADTLGSYAGPERFFHILPDFALTMDVPFGRNAYAAARGNHVVLGSSDALALDVHDGDGALLRRIRIVIPPLPVSSAEAEAQRDSAIAAFPERMRDAYREMQELAPRRETHPAFTALALDDDGRIWVRLPATTAAPAAQWLILSSTGAPVGRLSIGAGLEIEEVGRDYVLIRSTDADGVESIRLHSLSRG